MNPTITYRRNDRRYEVGHFDLPTANGIDKLLPAPIAKARNKMLELATQQNLTMARLASTEQAITDGPVLDAKALGDAIVAGKPDPGPVHLNAAKEAHADAVRIAEGTQQAVHAARRAYWDVMVATDRTDAVAAIEQKAAETIAPVTEMLENLLATILEYRGLRTLAAVMATFPSVPEPRFVDMQQVGQAISKMLEEVKNIGPVYEAPVLTLADELGIGDGPAAA